MNRHQVITGAANNSESSVAIGSVENNHFTAYGSGGNLIILSSNFDRVQIISSKNISNNSNDILKCIDCTLDTGKIAAAYGNRVYIFEPTPSAKKPLHNIKYKWVKVGAIEFESEIVCISWNNDGSRLLVACERGTIQMWLYDPNSSSSSAPRDHNIHTPSTTTASKKESAEVRFSVFSTDESTTTTNTAPSHIDDDSLSVDDSASASRYMFRKIWQTTLSNPVKFLKFSPDGSLFASFGENDRLVKVWHELKYVSKMISPIDMDSGVSSHQHLEYGFVYLNHPRAVTSLSWRQISRFMPRGTVSNSLITSCKDNICRIWTETLIPDDGLLHAHQYDSTYKSIAKSSSHKRKLLNKLHRMRLHPHFPHLFNSKASNEAKPTLSQVSETSTSQQPSTLHINSSQSTLNLAMRQPPASTATTPNHHHNHLSPSTYSSQLSATPQPGQLTSSLSCSELYLKPSPSFAGTNTTGGGSQSAQAQYMQHHHTSHFHLAGFIDPEAGIPLHLIKSNGGSTTTSTSKQQQQQQQTVKQPQSIQSQFVVHWMNNKDFHFTYLAELCSKEIYEKILKIQAGKENAATGAGDSSSIESATTSGDEEENKRDEDEDDDAGVRFEARSADVVVIKTKSDNSYDVFENINLDDETKGLLFGKSIDQKLDSFVKDWYASHDILFCVHPLDGSILIWVVDWLDEFMPNSYRQAQVSFHAKLPNTIPIGDAVSLTNSIYLYTDTEPIRIRSSNNNHNNSNNNVNQKPHKRKARKSLALNSQTTGGEEESTTSGSSTQAPTQSSTSTIFSTGVVYMVSKHSNGTLNLWKLQFQENSKYQSLVNVSHMYRVCGHRFRVGHITSHPILPFLLTNSAKWNSPDNDIKGETTSSSSSSKHDLKEIQSSPFCVDLWQHSHKSLIIWGVEPIGPLSKTGGIYELARIDSPKRNAFENIAWFPCFLPSFTLGNSSSSPSTLFASTDADQITIYQAVFDARTLLHDLLTQKASSSQPVNLGSAPMSPTKVPNSISFSSTKDIPYDNFNVVSIQSTARPGCIIELEQLPDSCNSGWTKADLFHIYQEGFVVRCSSASATMNTASSRYPPAPSQSTTSADSSSTSPEARFTQFNETYFLVLLEKKRNMSERVHMWKVNIQSSPMIAQSNEYNTTRRPSDSRLTITNTRVCQQDLPLPESVYVVCADPAAADLSSSSMFTINKAPYLFTTACSDGVVRFWSCRELDEEVDAGSNNNNEFEFVEWKLDSTMTSPPSQPILTPTTTTTNNQVEPSQVKIENFPLAISCSYNSRFAVAYKRQLANNDAHYYVRIYECESTGGSEWKCEDCIHFKNIVLPELDSGINFDYIIGKEKPIKPVMSSHSFKNIVLGSNRGGGGGGGGNGGGSGDTSSGVDSQPSHQTPEIPSTAAKMSIKKKFFPTSSGSNQQPNHEDEVSLHYNKCLIKLDWASTENGSHILTIGLGNKIYVYSCVSKEIFNLKDDKQQVHENNGDDSLVKWILFRSFELDSADDMQALPTQIKWVRDGLLIIGLDTEMQVYSQWSSLQKAANAAKKSAALPPITQVANSTLAVPTIQISNKDATDSTSTTTANKQVSSLIIPKNHSVMDLNKLNKAASTGMAAKDAAGAKTPLRNDMLNLGIDEVDTNTTHKKTPNLTTTVTTTKQTGTRFFDESEILEIVQDSGLFMQAKHARPVLPQYHPKQLLELMNAGKINRVKAILMHLTRCIIDFELKSRNKNTVNSEKKLKRKMSVCCESEIPEEQPLNYLEVETIPPLPLFALYAADDDLLTDISRSRETSTNNPEASGDSRTKKPSIDLMDELKSDPFDANEMNLTYDNDEDMSPELKQKMLEKRLNEEKAELKRQILNETHSTTNYFNSKVCRLLVEYLSYVQLSGLTSIDQMYLVALADTVTNVKCDVNFTRDGDLFSRKAAFMASTGGGTSSDETSASASGANVNGSNQVVDNCGFKFLLALRSYNYLMRTLPVKNRERLRQVGIGTFNFAWAFHSECEHELLEALPFNSNSSGDPAMITWADLKQYGVGWWLKSPQQLRLLIEKVAKCAFQSKMDPLDAAMFYLAMRKKGVLCGLFKTVKDTKMADFFKNDFNETKWQTAALKNAFVLLGKQRFDHAVAFFLLAGRLKDAIEVCLRNLGDLQLALVIVRLYETDFESLSHIIKSLLSVEILGHRVEPTSSVSSHLPNTASSNSLGKISLHADPKHISHDPFLRSMSYWYIKDYKQALNTLFDVDINSSKKSAMSIISHVFNFYSFLKHHPLVLKQQQLEFGMTNGTDENSAETPVADRVTPVERRLHFVSAYYHLINGCPLLALDVLSKLPKYIYSISKPTSEKAADLDGGGARSSSAPIKIEKAEDFDWSTPMNRRLGGEDDDELDLHISSSDDEDDQPDLIADKKKKEEEKSKMTTNNASQPGKLTSQLSVDSTITLTDGSKNGKIVDTFAQQLKFISCLKILIEEMSTLANGFEVVGGQLRYYMYYWLERETELLKKLGDHKSMQSKESSATGCELSNALLDEQAFSDLDEASLDPTRTTMLHEQVLREQKTFQEKINRVNKRKEWLRSNELLLRTFLSYCSLHGSSAAGLNSVKMELVLLMQELVEDRSMKQLLYPLRVQTSIPLLSASIASSKSIVAGPIQMIKSIGTDILATIIGIGRIPTIFDYSVLIATLKESAISLSSCIYQCLCDSDVVLASAPFVHAETTGAGMQGFSRNILYKSSYLMSGIRNRTGGSLQMPKPTKITTSPKNWPGISNLNKLLEREQDTEAPKLKVLLLESLVAVYCSLLINAMVFYDCSTLWRLLAKPWDEVMWNRLFGGGCHSECRYKTQTPMLAPLDDEGAKQRMRVNNKLGYKLSFSTSPMGGGLAGTAAATARMMMGGGGEEKVEIRETFVAPEISMINFFLSDPDIEDDVKMANEEYESDEELSESRRSGGGLEDTLGGSVGKGGGNMSDFEDIGGDDDDDPNRTLQSKRSHEHMNPKSYSWCLIRYAILKLSISSIGSFLNVIGIEAQEIAIQSPLIHQVIKSFEKWSELLYAELNSFYPNGPPQDYLGELVTTNAASTNVNSTPASGFGNVAGPKIFKYQALLDPNKTPFVIEKSTYPVRRLWLLLVTRKSLYDLFIRNIILKGSKTSATDDSTSRRGLGLATEYTPTTNNYSSGAIKIVHKDQEAIYSFCLNERDKNVVAFCTAKDIIEIDMKGLLMRSSGREDECDIDLSLQGTPRSIYDNEVYVVREANPLFMTSSTSNQQSGGLSQGGTLNTGTPNIAVGTPGTLPTTGGISGANQVTLEVGHQKPQFVRANDLSVSVLLKRSIKETRRLSSHPTLPYYLSGTNESVVKLWHWGSSDALSSFKQTEKGSSAKITKLQFNSQGNKFGVSDVDGYLHLYQLLGCSFKAYLTLKCYQIINDFLFIDSSSILLTIGTSNDSYVVSLWDTLLPSNKSLIKSFKEADTPSGTCVAYSLLNHLVYCGNRKGEVNIYDIRMHKKIQRLIAHESCVKAVTLDADEYYMSTGSSEGNVKLWNSKTFECLQVFHNEHSKSSIIRSLNSGVNQLTFTSQNQLLSCGADGTIVIRNLA